jgi:ornithine carbamoyltransferase
MAKLFGKYKHWIADEKHMAMGKDHVQYMHCLPCERGQEVSNEVLDGKYGHATWVEAENRLHAQKAIMSLIMA